MYNLRIKTFKQAEQLVEAYSKPVGGKEGRKQGIRSKDTRSVKSARRSERRIRTNIRDKVYSNLWLWFGTLTFAPGLVDRYSWDECCRKVRVFMDNYIRRKAPGMTYIIRPELHKDGAIHFHILIAGADPVDLVESGIMEYGRMVFNWSAWKWGFSNLTRVEDSGKCATYMLKYITDDLSGIPVGKKAYFSSRKLDKPKEETYLLKLQYHEILSVVGSLTKNKETVWEHDFLIDSGEYAIQGIRKYTKDIPQEVLTSQVECKPNANLMQVEFGPGSV